MKRSGLITTKIGMTRLYDDGGVAHPVTVLAVGDCTVIGNRTQEKNGYIQPGYLKSQFLHFSLMRT